MEMIILIPTVACWVVLARGSVRKALVWVYLPSLLLLPHYFVFRPPHMPPITFGDAAILPLGAAMLSTEMRRWRWAWMDLWVFLFSVSISLSEALSRELAYGDWVHIFSGSSATSSLLSYNINNGIFQFFACITTMILPYMLGKLLIERAKVRGIPMRKVMVRAISVMLATVSVISVYDFLTAGNSWQRLFRNFFASQTVEWPIQVRWGFGRIAGPYAHAILAGMVFLTGFIYCLWLLRADPRWANRVLIAGSPIKIRTLALLAVVVGLVMTQSRGPWLGVILSLILIGLLRVLSAGRAAIAFLLVLAAFGSVTFFLGEAYTRGSREQASSQEQASAIYRRQLLETYTPFVKQRIAFGWGVTDYPQANGQGSIDNQFLYLAVTQGFVGLGLFLLIGAGSGFRLVGFFGRPMEDEDRSLVLAHLAVLIGLLTTLTTVYMGEQVVPLFFLVIGWIQGTNPLISHSATAPATARPLRFRRVLV